MFVQKDENNRLTFSRRISKIYINMDFEIDRKMDCSIIKLLTVLYLKIFNEYQLKTKIC